MAIVLWVLLVLNVAACLALGLDKWKAVKGKYRTQETTLLGLGVFGGIGFIVGMVLFHHKTSKPKFRYTAPVFVLIQMVALVYCLMQF